MPWLAMALLVRQGWQIEVKQVPHGFVMPLEHTLCFLL
jgi:hypothetical protein